MKEDNFRFPSALREVSSVTTDGTGKVSLELLAALESIKDRPPMTEDEIEEQRQSFVRAEAPCKHGNPDWDICPKCCN